MLRCVRTVVLTLISAGTGRDLVSAAQKQLCLVSMLPAMSILEVGGGSAQFSAAFQLVFYPEFNGRVAGSSQAFSK